MTLSRWRTLALAIGTLASLSLAIGIAYLAGRGCSGTMYPASIDAGPGERVIAAELDAAVQRERERLDALIREQQATLAALGERDRAEFDAAKRRGREELARWFASRMPDGGRL